MFLKHSGGLSALLLISGPVVVLAAPGGNLVVVEVRSGCRYRTSHPPAGRAHPLLLYESFVSQEYRSAVVLQHSQCLLHPGAWVPRVTEFFHAFLKILEEAYMLLPGDFQLLPLAEVPSSFE